ncbi:pyridoxamine 5'-phosphate oxidase family protein [Roseicella frigidaeris]|uniref:Pyridoxamine 5-phosphate oxidase n=1 Tax=Roseicella frigidaeris TaxID=2230885 RepID=A0A327ME19_9PROT|nr:pyridoxamine 5'-phosphate oxidase family protein [Roseicella frigidaeris]RAI58458.1 pyridoxamine 5-phosphate oxidase [Roseicella frigidaeris]
MGRHYARIAFTPAVRAEQQRIGSLAHYARMAEAGREDDALTGAEAGFIAARDSLTMASVSETGWPYLQHRGGPPGFVRVLDARHIAFAELGGNRQHVSRGNLAGNDRVALFFMDYPNRRRLKLLGHARVVEDEPALLARLAPPGEAGQAEVGRAEAAIVIEVAGFEWNCPQHITPRYTAAEWAALAQG